MPFSGDDFQLLKLPPNSGPLARQLQNISAGLTELKGETFTLDAAAIIAGIPGTPGNNQIIKYDLMTQTIRWADDAVGMAGGGEENVQADWDVTDATSDAFLLHKPSLFSGAYGDLSGLPTLFSGSYNDLTNKPTIPQPTTVDAASIIAAVTGSPTAVNNRIEWQAGALAWAADTTGMGGGVTFTDSDWDARFVNRAAENAISVSFGDKVLVIDDADSPPVVRATQIGNIRTYIRGTIISNADLNATASLESTNTAPSRQVVAELRDTLVGMIGMGGGGPDTNSFVTAGAFSLNASNELSLQLTGDSGFTPVDIPGITLPAGGGGGSTTPNQLYYAHMADITVSTLEATDSTTWIDLTSGLTETINVGTFTVTTAGTPERDKVVVPAGAAGTYEVTGFLSGVVGTGGSTDRTFLDARIRLDRSGTVTTMGVGSPSYARNQFPPASNELGSEAHALAVLEEGDEIWIEGLLRGQDTSNAFVLDGGQSVLSLIRVDRAGPVGPEGPRGLPGMGSGGANVQADWTVTDVNSDAYIQNKPTLFSGAYGDLSGIPTLFSGAYADLSGLPTLFSGAYSDLSGQPDLSVYASDLSHRQPACCDWRRCRPSSCAERHNRHGLGHMAGLGGRLRRFARTHRSHDRQGRRHQVGWPLPRRKPHASQHAARRDVGASRRRSRQCQHNQGFLCGRLSRPRQVARQRVQQRLRILPRLQQPALLRQRFHHRLHDHPRPGPAERPAGLARLRDTGGTTGPRHSGGRLGLRHGPKRH